MKTNNWVSIILAVGLAALSGCGKSDKDTAQSIPATMDLAKFEQAFPAATADQQAQIAKVMAGVRYRLYPDALAGVQKLAADPGLSEAQKKAVKEMQEGIKQEMAKAAAPPVQ